MKELSELTLTVAKNFGAIREAWEHFRNDITTFNSQSYKMIKDICRIEEVEDKFEFEVSQNIPEKEGAWSNFYSTINIDLNIKPSDLKVFRKGVATLAFEIAFDEETGKFMYGVYFKNHNKLNTELDEILFKNEELRSRFQGMKKYDPNIIYFRYSDLEPNHFAAIRDDTSSILGCCKKLFQ